MIGDECPVEIAPGLTCSRDEGHDGPHWAEGEVPPVIGMMLEQAVTMHEHAARAATRARRYYVIIGVLWFVSFAANVIATTAGGSVTWLSGMIFGAVLGSAIALAAVHFGGRLRAYRDRQAQPPTEETL